MATYTGSDKRLAYLFERTEDMQGATASTDGVAGIVPAPEAGDEEKYLKGDGTWSEVQHKEVYDTTEQVIGNFFGVPLYKRTYTIYPNDLTEISTGYYTYTLDFDILTMVDVEAVFVTSGANCYNYPCEYLTEIIAVVGGSNLLRFAIPYLSYLDNGLGVTIKYTKRTT